MIINLVSFRIKTIYVHFTCAGTILLQNKFLPSSFARRPELFTWEALSSSAETCR